MLGWAAHFLWCAVWERCTLHTAACSPPAPLLPSYLLPSAIKRIYQFSVLTLIFSPIFRMFFADFSPIKEGSPLAPVAAVRLELAEYNVHQNICKWPLLQAGRALLRAVAAYHGPMEVFNLP